MWRERTTWLFAVAVLLQLLILAAVPAQKLPALLGGQTLTLQVRPVDPYNILSGYYMTLDYAIAEPSVFPGEHSIETGQRVYAVVSRAGDEGPWQPLRLEFERPRDLPAGQAALRGSVDRRGDIVFGIEQFHVPEASRQAIAKDFAEHPDEAWVTVKVDAAGRAALLSLHIQDRVYE